MSDTIIDRLASEAGKVDGMARAEQGSPPGWIEQAIETIRWVAQRYAFLITDDLWARGLPKPHEPRALGPGMKRAQALGLIEPIDEHVATDQKLRHRGSVRVWRSKLFGEDVPWSDGYLFLSRRSQARDVEPVEVAEVAGAAESSDWQSPEDDGDVRRLVSEHGGPSL